MAPENSPCRQSSEDWRDLFPCPFPRLSDARPIVTVLSEGRASSFQCLLLNMHRSKSDLSRSTFLLRFSTISSSPMHHASGFRQVPHNFPGVHLSVSWRTAHYG